MKVLYVIMHLKKGGAELMLARLANEIAKDESILINIVSLTKIEQGDILFSNNVKVHALDFNKFSPTSWFKTFNKLIKIMREFKPDIVHTWMYLSDFIGGIVAKFLGIKNIIWSIRNTKISHSNLSINFLILKLNSVLSYYIPNRIVSVSDIGSFYHKEIGYCKHKFKTIHNGYELSSFIPEKSSKTKLRHFYGLDSSDFVVLTIARYDHLKDHDTLLKVAMKLKLEHSNIKFVLVGRNILNKELKYKISELDLNDIFSLHDFTNNTFDFYNLSDIYLSTSKFEGFPNVVCEAMLMELVPVATNAGESNLIIGDSGFVTDVGDVDSLANSISKLYHMEKNLRQNLSIKAKNRIISEFGLDKIINEYKQLYKELDNDK